MFARHGPAAKAAAFHPPAPAPVVPPRRRRGLNRIQISLVGVLGALTLLSPGRTAASDAAGDPATQATLAAVVAIAPIPGAEPEMIDALLAVKGAPGFVGAAADESVTGVGVVALDPARVTDQLLDALGISPIDFQLLAAAIAPGHQLAVVFSLQSGEGCLVELAPADGMSSQGFLLLTAPGVEASQSQLQQFIDYLLKLLHDAHNNVPDPPPPPPPPAPTSDPEQW